jgi:hypothetical protein
VVIPPFDDRAICCFHFPWNINCNSNSSISLTMTLKNYIKLVFCPQKINTENAMANWVLVLFGEYPSSSVAKTVGVVVAVVPPVAAVDAAVAACIADGRGGSDDSMVAGVVLLEEVRRTVERDSRALKILNIKKSIS